MQLISCRMVKMSFECGQCKDTVIGLAFVAFALLKYSDDIESSSNLGRITESLMEGHPDEHYLRANLTQPTVCVRCFTQPFQATGDACLNGYRSANIVGDVDNAIHCRMMYCICNAVSLSDLIGLRKYLVDLLNQMVSEPRCFTSLFITLQMPPHQLLPMNRLSTIALVHSEVPCLTLTQ